MLAIELALINEKIVLFCYNFLDLLEEKTLLSRCELQVGNFEKVFFVVYQGIRIENLHDRRSF